MIRDRAIGIVPALVVAAHLATVMAVPCAARAQAAIESPEGLAHFQRGREHYEAQRYASALDEFRQSLQTMPSPNTRLYVARSLRELNRAAEAYGEYLQAAIEADERSSAEPRYVRAAESARQEAQALLPRIALLTVVVTDAPTGTTIAVDGQPLDSSRWNTEAPHEPGTVAVEAHAPGRAPYRSTQTLQAGVQSRVEIRLAPVAATTAEIGEAPAPVVIAPVSATPTPSTGERGGGLRAVGGILSGVGLVSLIVGTAAGALAQSNYNTLHNCANPPLDMMMNPMPPQDCPTGAVLVSAVNNGSTEETVANVAWGIGAGVGALGVGLLVAGVVQGGSETNAAGPRVTLIVDPSHGFAGIRGTF